MSRKRKPVVKPMEAAIDSLFWRATVLTEMLDGLTLPPQLAEPIKRMQQALSDYEHSKGYVNGVARSPQMELQV
jgi:hypothetical protein